MIASTASSALCGACSGVILESADQCLACGSAREREPFFYSVSLIKLAVLGATSLWLYSVWWFGANCEPEPQRRTLGHAAEDYLFRNLLLLDCAGRERHRLRGASNSV